MALSDMSKILFFMGLLRCGQGGSPVASNAFAPENQPQTPAVANKVPLLPEWELTCPTGSWLTYENFGKGFMTRHCTSCHHADLGEGARAGAPLPVNLETLDGILTWRERILATTTRLPADTNPMPPVNTVSAGERKTLQEWIACGTPSNPG
jgi:hypothetical protein